MYDIINDMLFLLRERWGRRRHVLALLALPLVGPRPERVLWLYSCCFFLYPYLALFMQASCKIRLSK